MTDRARLGPALPAYARAAAGVVAMLALTLSAHAAEPVALAADDVAQLRQQIAQLRQTLDRLDARLQQVEAARSPAAAGGAAPVAAAAAVPGVPPAAVPIAPASPTPAIGSAPASAPAAAPAPAPATTAAPGAGLDVHEQAVLQEQVRTADALAAWRALRTGMGQDEVRRLLGAPQSTLVVGNRTGWIYTYRNAGKGSVFFSHDGTVVSLIGPAQGALHLY